MHVWAVWDNGALVGLFEQEADARIVASDASGLPALVTRLPVVASAHDTTGILDTLARLDLPAKFEAEGRTRWSEADADGDVTVHYNMPQLLSDLMAVVHSGGLPDASEALADQLLVRLAAELGVDLTESGASDE